MNSNGRVVFAGLARDCAHSLPRLLKAISQLGGRFQDWGYVFLENDSVDRTARTLQDFHQIHDRGEVQSLNGLDRKFNLRTERLAWLRNHCLEIVFDHPTLGAFDYLVILDLDAVNEVFDSKRLIALTEMSEPDWTAVFANQSERYYDIWALRHPTWSPDDCWKQIRERPADMSREEAIDVFLEKRRIKLDRPGFTPVQSAFGGLGLYRLQALRGCKYRGVCEEGFEVCEHVAFHQDLVQAGGRLFIDSELINGRGNHRHNSGMNWITRAPPQAEKMGDKASQFGFVRLETSLP